MHIVDIDVDLNNLEAGHPLHRLLDVALDAVREVGDADPVFDDDVEVDGSLRFADLHAYAASDVRVTERPGDDFSDRAEGTARVAAHRMDAADLPAGDPCDLLYDRLGNGDLAGVWRAVWPITPATRSGRVTRFTLEPAGGLTIPTVVSTKEMALASVVLPTPAPPMIAMFGKLMVHCL